MKPLRIPRPMVMLGAILLVVGAVAVIARQRTGGSSHPASSVSKVTYYCPMHPSYTSDRPGDCPICNMRLVKKESVQQIADSGQEEKKAAKDICYLHNCPKMHGGTPCPMLVVAKAGEQVTCPVCGTHVVGESKERQKKIVYWTDPMIPGYKADKPGKSPMGMDLVPVYEEAATPGASSGAAPEGYAPILVTPQKRQLIGITTAAVERRTLTKTIRTVGQIANDPELYQAEQEYLQALRALAQAKAGASTEVVEQAQRMTEAGHLRLRRMGLSHELIEEIGTWNGPDQRLLLADPDGQVWLYAPIYEFELPLVTVGQSVTVDVQAIPGKTLRGVIKSIDPVLDPATRAARVRAVLTDPDGVLKPEMFVNASIAVEVGNVLAVPEEAVFDTGTKRIAFVDQGQGVFEPRDVEVGVKAEGYDEIKSGLTEGEKVVTSGNFLIDSESRLKAALEGMAGTEEHHHGQ